MLAQAIVAITMHFSAPRAKVTAAFGPVSESVWDPTFQPHFVAQSKPLQVPGAVFTTGSKAWLLHDYDPAKGVVQYVIFEPGSLVVTLTIRVVGDPAGSDATMTYDLVPLNAGGAAHARELRQHAREMSAAMQSAIAGYLGNQPGS
jgi:hypothetical protein